MGRIPEPWWWDERGGWYATVRGKRRPLGKGTKTEAKKALAEVMREEGRAVEQPVLSSKRLVAMYLQHCTRRVSDGDMEAVTLHGYARRLKTFPVACGHIEAQAIKPKDIQGWLDGHAWGPTTRHDHVEAVKGAFRWAVRMGHLTADPLVAMKKPRRNKRRQLVMSGDGVPLLLASIRSARFFDLVLFLHWTGARPGEGYRLCASHVDAERSCAVLKGKSTNRTGKQRVIHLPAHALELCLRLAERNPSGPLFRNEDGEAWNKDSVNCQIRRCRARAGAGRGMVAYALRHIFATDALSNGAGLAATAELLGHSDTRVLSEVYSHLSERHDAMQAALAKVRPSSQPQGPPPTASPPQPTKGDGQAA